jgi:excisionase family DNA binding protein
MAGMFYSLEEVAEKLNKTEQEVKEMIKQGKLREFRDGPNLLFKVDEVEALLSDTAVMASKESSATPENQTGEDEISLASEPPELQSTENGLTDADTVVSGEGTRILGEADSEQKVTDDLAGETKAESDEVSLASSSEAALADDIAGETRAEAGEASLEEIEEDVNLDTFGSGSGLLDLSLQADDTSLGGILDEIYTPEGEEGGDAVAPGSAVEVGADAEQMLSETLQPGLEAPTMVRGYAEPEPDTISNAFGFMLFLPLLAVVYTAVVAVAGFSDLMPAVLEKIQGAIWYIVIGVVVAACLIVGGAFMLTSSGEKAAKKPKAKKQKKQKAEETAEPASESETEA